MNALRLLVACVVCVVRCCVSLAEAQYALDGFLLGSLGVHTADGNAFTGLTGYLGGRKGNKGFGVLGSYEVGAVSAYGEDIRLQLINVYFSGSYRIGQSIILLSYGGSHLIATLDEDKDERSGDVMAITYAYNYDSRFVFMGQVRVQGKGLMLSAGVGF